MSYINYLKQEYGRIASSSNHYCFTGDYIPHQMIEYGQSVIDPNCFHLDLLPQQVLGSISDGKIFICSLNPGLSEDDYFCEDVNLAKAMQYPYHRNDLLCQLSQSNATHFLLAEHSETTSGAKWWRKKFKGLVSEVHKAYKKNGINVPANSIYEMLSRLVVALELFPYHSKGSGYISKVMAGCDGVKEIKAFVHDELIPNAAKNEQIVLFTRSIKLWQVTPKEQAMTNVVYCNSTPRSFSFGTHKHMGKMIFDHLSKLTNGFTTLI